jgi:c-di-GMP-binding flagellar brake protein YcgR
MSERDDPVELLRRANTASTTAGLVTREHGVLPAKLAGLDERGQRVRLRQEAPPGALPIGGEVAVEILQDGVALTFHAAVLAGAADGVVQLGLPEALRLVQPRRKARTRLASALAVEVEVAGRKMKGRLVDLSSDGACVALPPAGLRIGDAVERVAFSIGEGASVAVPATVRSLRPGVEIQVGLEFVGLGATEAGRLSTYALRTQREALRKRVETRSVEARAPGEPRVVIRRPGRDRERPILDLNPMEVVILRLPEDADLLSGARLPNVELDLAAAGRFACTAVVGQTRPHPRGQACHLRYEPQEPERRGDLRAAASGWAQRARVPSVS